MNIKETVFDVPYWVKRKVRFGCEPEGTSGPQATGIIGTSIEDPLSRFRLWMSNVRVDMQVPTKNMGNTYIQPIYQKLLEVVGRNRTYTVDDLIHAVGAAGNVAALAVNLATVRKLMKMRTEVSQYTYAVYCKTVGEIEDVLDLLIAWINDQGFCSPIHLAYLKHRLGYTIDKAGIFEDNMLLMHRVVGTLIGNTHVVTDTTLTSLHAALSSLGTNVNAVMRDISAYCDTVKISSYEQLEAEEVPFDEFKFITLTTGGFGTISTVDASGFYSYKYATPAPRNTSYADDTMMHIPTKMSQRDSGLDVLDYAAFDAITKEVEVSPGNQTIMIDSISLKTGGDDTESIIYGSCNIGNPLTQAVWVKRFAALINYLDLVAGFRFDVENQQGDYQVVSEPIGIDTTIYKKDAYDMQVRLPAFRILGSLKFITKEDGNKKSNSSKKKFDKKGKDNNPNEGPYSAEKKNSAPSDSK